MILATAYCGYLTSKFENHNNFEQFISEDIHVPSDWPVILKGVLYYHNENTK
jgi:hypothetical protein